MPTLAIVILFISMDILDGAEPSPPFISVREERNLVLID